MTIAEVSKKYDLTADTLRYYERIGLLPAVNRTSGGNRDYTDEDCGWVEFIKCMRGAGIEVEALIDYIVLHKQGDSTAEARKQILIEQREKLCSRMTDMQKTLDKLDYKIDVFYSGVQPSEQKLKNPEVD